MKKLWIKISEFIKKMYSKLIDESKIYIPTAIKVVEAIKSVTDSQVDDIILGVIKVMIPNLPHDKIDIIKKKIEDQLPKIILELNLVNVAVNSDNLNDQLQLILNALKLSSDEIKAEKYHVLASKILVILSDGKITWSEAVVFTEWYYQNVYKK